MHDASSETVDSFGVDVVDSALLSPSPEHAPSVDAAPILRV
jgi:hypothetical protein